VALPHREAAIAQAAAVKELLRDSDGDGVPDILEGTHLAPQNRAKMAADMSAAVAEQIKQNERKPAGKANSALVVLVVFLLTGIGGYLVYRAESKDTEAPSRTETPPVAAGATAMEKPAEKPRRLIRDVCLLDANGDDVQDLMVLFRSQEKAIPGLWDGKDGSEIWSGTPYDEHVNIACLDEHWFVVATESFQLHFFHSRELGAPVRVKGADKLRAIQRGTGCVAFKTADRTRASVGLPSGMAQPCPTQGRMPRLTDAVSGVMPLSKKQTATTAGGVDYTLTTRKSGTPMLIVTAAKGKTTLWTKELAVRKPTYSAAIAVGDGVVAVIGSVMPHRDKVVLVGLKTSDGSPLYEVPLAERQTDHLNFMAYNGHGLVMFFGSKLQQRDISNGQLLWGKGG